MTLLIDADDTLWENITVFYEINARYAQWVAPADDPDAINLELDQIQKSFVGTYGYGRETFEHSLIEGIRRFANREPNGEDLAKVTELVRPLQWEDLVPYDGVEDTLTALGSTNRLILVTKGNEQEQLAKIERTGLGGCFEALEILAEKTAAEYARIVAEHNITVDDSWMIGNSPKSDILPALEVGLGAVHIPHEQTWSLELAELPEHPRLLRRQRFTDLVELFAGSSSAKNRS